MAQTPFSPDAPDKSRIDRGYDDKFNRVDELEHLKNMESLGDDPSTTAAKENANDGLKEQEEAGGGYINNFTGNGQANQGNPLQKLLGNAKATFFGSKKKGVSFVIIGGILGILGVGMGSLLPLGAIAAIQNLNLDLDDVAPSAKITAHKIIGRKFIPGLNDPVSVACAVPGSVKCKFGTMSKTMIERYERVGIKVTGDETGLLGRTKVTEIIGPDGKSYTPREFWTAINDRQGRMSVDSIAAAHNRAHEMGWLGHHGPSFINKTLKRFNVTMRTPSLEGTPQERALQLIGRSGGSSLNDISFSPDTDENGNQRKGYLDDNNNVVVDPNNDKSQPLFKQDGDTSGQLYTESVKDRIESSVGRLKIANAPVAKRALQTINVLGYLDMGCDIVNTIGSASVAAKVNNSEQLAMFALGNGVAGGIVPMVGAWQNGDLTPEQVETAGEFWFATDNRKTIQGINPDTEKEEQIPNPNYGKNALDSDLFNMSTNGGVAGSSATDTTYSLGFGVGRAMSSAASFASTTKYVSEIFGKVDTCGFVQSWPIRAGGMLVGVIGAFFTGGTSLAVQAGANVTVAVIAYQITNLLNNYLTMNLITEDILEAPVERGSAVWTGMAAVHSQAAQSRGMVPGNSEQIVAYQMEKNSYKDEYIAQQRQESSLFDITNPYSVTGSIALAAQNNLPSDISTSTVASLSSGISSFVFGGLASSLTPYSAKAQSLDPKRFEQCGDIGYKDIGLDADVQCNVRYFMPKEVTDKDPFEVAQWMEGNNADGSDNPDMPIYVEKDTEKGLPKGYTPLDPNKSQSLAKQIIMGQVNSIVNTRSYGDVDGRYSDEYGKFLDFCVDRVLPFGETYADGQTALGAADKEWQDGSICLQTEPSEKYSEERIEMLNNFRAYTFNISVSDDLDESPIVSDVNCGPFGGNSGGSVGGKISQNEVDAIIAKYSLPAPQAETVGAVTGYNDLIKQLQENPDAAWAVQALLNGEKTWKAAGGHMIEYLNTAWMWMENGQEMAPDPYQINCGENASVSVPSHLCETQNWQVGGYQAGDKAVLNHYTEVFDKLYPNYTDEQLRGILEEVLKNSDKAFLDKWDYNDASQQTGLIAEFKDQIGTATTGDIATNLSQLLGNRRTQFFTILLGKDPNMVAALNSYAVTDDDIGAMLISPSAHGWSNDCGTAHEFYCSPNLRPRISNMIMALYMFDGQGPSGGANCREEAGRFGNGVGISAVWGGEGEKDLSYGFGAQGVADWYGYGRDYGTNGTTHTGTDIPMEPYAPVYSPVEGIVVCERNGVGEGIQGAGCAGAGDFSLTGEYGCQGQPGKPGGAGTVMIEITNNGQRTGQALRLGHLADSIVKLGDKIKPNQQIGLAGCMNGFHTHVEYFIPEDTPSGLKLVDPVQYLGGVGGGRSGSS